MKNKILNGHLKNIAEILPRITSYDEMFSDATVEIKINDLVYLKKIAQHFIHAKHLENIKTKGLKK